MSLFKKTSPKKSQKPTPKGVLTAIFATLAAVFLLLLAGLSLAGTAVTFVVSLPLFVVFSPVLIPATLTTGLLVTTLAASGGSVFPAIKILMWLNKRLTGKKRPKFPGMKPAGGGRKNMALKPKKKPQKPTFKGVLTVIFATISAVFLLLLAGLSLGGTAVAFIAAIPLFVVFSPVLLPATLTTGLLVTTLAASFGSGLPGVKILMWLYKRLTGKEPPGGDAGPTGGDAAPEGGDTGPTGGDAAPEGGDSAAGSADEAGGLGSLGGLRSKAGELMKGRASGIGSAGGLRSKAGELLKGRAGGLGGAGGLKNKVGELMKGRAGGLGSAGGLRSKAGELMKGRAGGLMRGKAGGLMRRRAGRLRGMIKKG